MGDKLLLRLNICGNTYINNGSTTDGQAGGRLIFDNGYGKRGPNKISMHSNQFGFGVETSAVTYHSINYHKFYSGNNSYNGSTNGGGNVSFQIQDGRLDVRNNVTDDVTIALANVTDVETSTIVAGLNQYGAASQSIYFNIANGSGGSSEVLRIRGDGRVGINDNTPSVELDVNGSIAYTGGLSGPSDERVKENQQIKDYDDVYNKFKLLDIKTFNWEQNFKEQTKQTRDGETGIIAQELEAIFPSAVKQIEKYGYEDFRVVNKDELYMNALCVIKKLQEKVELLEQKIN